MNDDAKPIVLIVDDTPDNLALLSALLKASYRVRVANGGERALKMAAVLPPPDLVLLDVMMPDMDGFEVCRRLKSDPATSAIPVVFVTAAKDQETVNTAFAAGGKAILSKPVDAVKLHELVRQICGR